MMKRALYCTADHIEKGTGGGIVTYNELQALQAVAERVDIIDRSSINPAAYDQPDSPFLEDYFALQIAQKNRYDLAHFYSGCFTQTVSWLKSRGAKVTYTVAAHDRHASIEEFGRLGYDYPFYHVSNDSLWQTYTEGIRKADIVVAPSTKSAEVLKSDVKCENDIRIIPHGVDIPQVLTTPPEEFSACYIGQVGPDKGLGYLIEAWGNLNYPDAELVMAGVGTDSLGAYIRQVSNTGIFTLLGRVDDIAAVYSRCSVAVFPSVTEGFGIGILEAMAHCRPVIASDGAGAAEMIKDSVDGFRVPARNPGRIAEVIDFLYKNRGKISVMGNNGHKKAVGYTWEKVRKQYIDLFASL